jgi:DNA repair protein RadC
VFRGTLTQTSVYPREVVKAALGRNAAASFYLGQVTKLVTLLF